MTRRQAIIWTNADPIHCHIYVALRGDELKGEEQARQYHEQPFCFSECFENNPDCEVSR